MLRPILGTSTNTDRSWILGQVCWLLTRYIREDIKKTCAVTEGAGGKMVSTKGQPPPKNIRSIFYHIDIFFIQASSHLESFPLESTCVNCHIQHRSTRINDSFCIWNIHKVVVVKSRRSSPKRNFGSTFSLFTCYVFFFFALFS